MIDKWINCTKMT